MYLQVHPKLPMREKSVTKNYYTGMLGFTETGTTAYPDYLMLKKDQIEIHFFLFKDLNPAENDGQVYIRVQNIDSVYQHLLDTGVAVHPNGKLESKPWRQKEFSLLDPDNNLLTFGEPV